MEYGTLLLSKAIDENDPKIFARYNIAEQDFPTESERQVFRFVEAYAETHGQAPSYGVVAAEIPDFGEWFAPDISDSAEYLANKIKDYRAKVSVSELMAAPKGQSQSLFERKFNELDGNKFLDWLISEADRIKIGTDVRKSIGKTFGEIKTSFRDEYLKREEGKSFKRWDTPFATLTGEVGGWFSGDVYGIIAESGRGKTYLMCKIIDSLLRQGARVLVKSFEVKEYVWMSRLVSIATAYDELLCDEMGRKLGLPNKQILAGKLDGVTREQFLQVVESLDAYYPGTLYFQGKSDANLTRSLKELDGELSTGKIDAVVLDPFYGLTDVYGKNANKTSGGAAEQAATKFEQIIGDHDVVGFYTVQATVEKKKRDEEGARELKLPTRDQVKTSMRLLDIATNLIAFDSLEKEGQAILGIEKGRNGGEDMALELMALFDYGVLKEYEAGESAIEKFEF